MVNFEIVEDIFYKIYIIFIEFPNHIITIIKLILLSF